MSKSKVKVYEEHKQFAESILADLASTCEGDTEKMIAYWRGVQEAMKEQIKNLT